MAQETSTPLVDDVLGPAPVPTVDDVLGPDEPVDRVLAPPGDASDDNKRMLGKLMENTAVGRVLSAFGHGVREGFGDRDIGLPPEAERALRDVGLLTPLQDRQRTIFHAFNEAIIWPAAGTLAAAADTLFRAIPAGIFGVAEGVGKISEELGASEASGRRLTRDVVMLLDTAGIVSGVAPTQLANRGVARAIRSEEAIARRVVRPSDEIVDAPLAGSVKTAQKGPEVPIADTTPAATVKPPASAVDRAGNINLELFDMTDEIKDIVKQVARENIDFLDVRRGVRTFEETKQAAAALGLDYAKFQNLKIGESFNPEELYALSQYFKQSSMRVQELGARASITGSFDDLLALKDAMDKLTLHQAQLSGATAEAGRSLNVLRQMREARTQAENVAKVVEAAGGGENMLKVAQMLRELDTPEKIAKFLEQSRKATTMDKIVEIWLSGLFSNPVTHVVNTVSNTIVGGVAVPEAALAAGYGKVFSSLPGSGGIERVLIGEAAERTFGFFQGAREGVPLAWKAFKDELPSQGSTKLEVAKLRATGDSAIARTARVPLRALMAEDELFKAIGRQQEINALAYRQAAREGLTGDAFYNRIAELKNNPTKQMLDKAAETALTQTFQSKLGDVGSSVQRFSNSHPALKFIIPVVRTPANLLKYSAERTPLGFLSKRIRDDISGVNGAVKQQEAAARMTLGTLVMGGTAALVLEGVITGGGPSDPRKRAIMYADGWQPYSMRIGEYYYSYQRMDPFATIVGIVADAIELGAAMSEDELDSVWSAIAGTVFKNLVNKTWLSGPADLIEAANDPERYGSKYAQRLISSSVPGLAAQIARVEDPVLRDAQSVLDAIRARTPYLSNDVLPRRDIWGEEIRREGASGPDLLSPVYMSRIKNDPVNQELLRLKVYPAKPEKKINGVELSLKQYDEYQMMAGKLAKQLLDNTVSVPGYYDLPAFARVDVVRRTIATARSVAKDYMLMQNPDLIEKAIQNRMQEMEIRP